VATILLAGVDLFFRGKLDALLGGSHKLITTDSVDLPDLVICDVARIDPYEVADSWPDIPILGYTNHTDTSGLRAAHEAGLDQVVARSALAERAPQLVADCALVTYIIAEPCIDIKDLSCVDVCPVDCIHVFDRMLIIDPEECIDCGACEPECPVEAIFPEDALPEKWEPFVKINYAYGDGADVINKLVDEYATEHNVQNPPLEPQ
jgi:NAD-dependent dihydropyrimidine dehydrogenase PreA subunit